MQFQVSHSLTSVAQAWLEISTYCLPLKSTKTAPHIFNQLLGLCRSPHTLITSQKHRSLAPSIPLKLSLLLPSYKAQTRHFVRSRARAQVDVLFFWVWATRGKKSNEWWLSQLFLHIAKKHWIRCGQGSLFVEPDVLSFGRQKKKTFRSFGRTKRLFCTRLESECDSWEWRKVAESNRLRNQGQTNKTE